MSALTDKRNEIADLLTEATGWKVYGHIPSRLAMPMGSITPDSPYITDGLTYGSVTVHLSVRLISATAPTQATTEDLDQAIEDALVALIEAGHVPTGVNEPAVLSINGGQYLSVDIALETPTQL